MNKSNYMGQTRKKSNRREVGIISLFAFFIIISRFLYVPFLGDNDIEGDFFEYTWLSSFLYSIGIEFSYLSFGFILFYATNFMEDIAAKYFKMLSCAILFVGFFFTSWILLESDKTNPVKEMLFSFVAAALAIWTLYILSKFIRTTTNKYINVIRNLFSFIYVEMDKKDYIKPEYKDDYINRRIELVDKAVENE